MINRLKKFAIVESCYSSQSFIDCLLCMRTDQGIVKNSRRKIHGIAFKHSNIKELTASEYLL